MNYTIRERLLRLEGKKLSSKYSSDILQTRVWLESLFRDEKISRLEFTQKIKPEGGESTGIVLLWLKGKHTVKANQVEKISGIFPGSEVSYNHPIFKLLRNKPISKANLKKIVAPFIQTFGGVDYWIFPQPTHKENMGLPSLPCMINDTSSLIERGDIYGFTSILYLLRMAEVKNRALDHQQYIKDVYQAMPGLCRHKYFQKRWSELFECVFQLHCRVPTSILLVRPKISVIKEQIHSPSHITRLKLRPKDPNTQRFSELALTYEETNFNKT